MGSQMGRNGQTRWSRSTDQTLWSLLRELAEEPLEPIGPGLADVAALLEVGGFGEAVEWVEAA